MAEELVYFIVDADRLAEYGARYGSSKEEAEELLSDLSVGTTSDEIVVILGNIVKPRWRLTDVAR